MDKVQRLAFCAEYCALKRRPPPSPHYFWLYEEDDDGERYEAYRRNMQRMEEIAKKENCDCDDIAEKHK